MSYQVIARKWRPQFFEEVIGQHHVVQTLQNAIVSGRIAHAMLFAGQRGVGKTSIARIMAKALNCEQGPTPRPCGSCTSCREIAEGSTLDVLEIDGASNTGVNDVRELRENVKYVPARGRYKIYIIDEVHMLSTPAFNALLKTLEEPPPHVVFMFATTEPHKIPPTVLSRCQRFDLRRISLEALVQHLRRISEREGITISDKGLRWIARDAEGSMRDAQSLLDRIIAYAGKEISDSDISEVIGMVDRDLLLRAAQAVIDNDAQACVSVVKVLFEGGGDMRQFYHAFLEQLRNMIMIKLGGEAARLCELSSDERAALARQVKDCDLETLQHLFDIWLRGEEDLYRSAMPQIIVEMLLLKLVYGRRLMPIDAALEKLADIERTMSGTAAGHAPAEAVVPSPLGNDGIGGIKKAAEDQAGQNRSCAEYPQTWPGFLAYLKRERPLLAAILDHGSLVALDEARLEVGFAPGSIFLESARDADKLAQLKKMSETFFGRTLRIVITTLAPGTTPPSESTDRDGGSVEQVEEPAQHHALLQKAISLFDATIVEVKKEEMGKAGYTSRMPRGKRP